MRRFVAFILVLAAAACIGAACSGASQATPGSATPAVSPVAFSTTQLRYARNVLRVEVASAPTQTERGLGYRDALAADAGMIFDLHETRVPRFWMKGMRFPLDMVWIDAEKRVVGVTSNVPPQPDAADAELRRYSPSLPVRWVLEVNAGAASRLGLTPGTQLSFVVQ